MLSHHRCTGTTCGELYGWMRVQLVFTNVEAILLMSKNERGVP